MLPTISVVVPVYNEREALPALSTRLSSVIAGSREARFEVIFVDDGSDDGSPIMLDEICAGNPSFRCIHLSRNFGHQAALQAGLDTSRGDAVVLMDADLQDPPELIGQMLEKWREGYDVVYAVRRTRQEVGWKRGAYRIFYRTLGAVASDVDIAYDAGDFSLIDRRVVEAMASLPERNRFLRGLRSWVGFRQVGVEYDRGPREAGHSKYTLRKLVALALSGYLGFSLLPLRLATWLGTASASVGAVIAVWALWRRLVGIDTPHGWASTVGIILFVGGVQLLILGVIGEYLGRVYEEVRRRPLYIVRSQVGWSDAQTSAADEPRRESSGLRHR